MSKSIMYRTWLTLGVIFISIFLAFPLDKKINLGLDLQGGESIFFCAWTLQN